MATPAIATAFYRRGGLLLALPVGTRVELGSIGYLNGGHWFEVSTVKKVFGIDLNAAEGGHQENSFHFASGRHFRLKTYADGETSELFQQVMHARPRAELTFAKSGAYAGNVKNQTMVTAESLGELMAAIRWAYHHRAQLPESERWVKGYAVVVGVASADSVIAISASDDDTVVAIGASAKLGAPMSLAEVDAGMRVMDSSKSYEEMWWRRARGYAFQALRLKPSILRRWDKVIPLDHRQAAPKVSRRRVQRPELFSTAIRTEDLEVDDLEVQSLKPSGAVAEEGPPAEVLGSMVGPSDAPAKRPASRRTGTAAKPMPRRRAATRAKRATRQKRRRRSAG